VSDLPTADQKEDRGPVRGALPGLAPPTPPPLHRNASVEHWAVVRFTIEAAPTSTCPDKKGKYKMWSVELDDDTG
jgi:hypothetical protein